MTKPPLESDWLVKLPGLLRARVVALIYPEGLPPGRKRVHGLADYVRRLIERDLDAHGVP